MNGERLAQQPNVERVETQNGIIQNSTSPEKIVDHYRTHFGLGGRYDWEKEFLQVVSPHGKGSLRVPEYYKLVAVTNNQGAQFGYESMEGQMFKKANYSSFDPRRELALAVHLAGLNIKAYAYKNAMSELYEVSSPLASIGIWGTWFTSKRGEFVDPPIVTVFDQGWFQKARLRGGLDRKVLEPHTDLNARLASLEFTLENAEEMDDHEFEGNVMPRIIAALGDFLDPVLAFHNSQRAPLRFYSFPNQ